MFINKAWAITLSYPETGLPGETSNNELVFGVIKATMQWLLILLGALSIIGIVIAGIIYLISAGDEERIERAKRATTYSIIGIIIALSGYVLIQAIDTWLSGNSTEF